MGSVVPTFLDPTLDFNLCWFDFGQTKDKPRPNSNSDQTNWAKE